MLSSIYILSQPIQTGKTTRLQNWIAGKQQIGGILTPDIAGKRMLYAIAEQTTYPFELNSTEQGTTIGRFNFDESVFEKARTILLHDISQPYDWVIVDEIGRLEITRKEGLEPAVSSLIASAKSRNNSPKLLLVVRDYLLEETIAHYQLQDAVLLDETFFKIPNSTLTGLVLCGGQSVRMGKDKAFITYHDLPQYAHVARMMQSFCGGILISCNSEQINQFSQQNRLIEDSATFANAGPMTGILSAFEQLPDTTLLVMGCDYPYFTKADMKALLEARDDEADVVCYHNSTSGFDEPLLAIYEKQCASLLLHFYQNGNSSLQQFLKTIRTKRIQSSNTEAIRSIDY